MTAPQNHHHDHAHDHAHAHHHPHGIAGVLHALFVPHSHDHTASYDHAQHSDDVGIRTLKVSLVVLLATTVLQAVVVALSGSVALLADTIHNLADALTAVPLWIAFTLAKRAPTRWHPFGLHRAEDLAGLMIVAVIALSAVVAFWEAVDRLVNPRPIAYLGWVIAAGVIGFVGNELVAVYRIRVGHRISSAALVADGVHARTDGFTSLAVVAGAIGVALGFPLADALVGLIIAAVIVVMLFGTVRSVGGRLLDGIDPALATRVEHALAGTAGVTSVDRVRLRWMGHRLVGDAEVSAQARATLSEVEELAKAAERHARSAVAPLTELVIRVRAADRV